MVFFMPHTRYYLCVLGIGGIKYWNIYVMRRCLIIYNILVLNCFVFKYIF